MASDRYGIVADRIMARSATGQGTMADQLAGDAAAELGLRRTEALADRLGRPQDDLTIIHVAGTKGKGSTVAFISSILVAGGHRVGRATSPHLASLTERIAIDERDIDDDTFAGIADRVLAAADASELQQPELGRVNAVEVLFVMALVAFRDAGCRVAVVEVGIGGRLDTTNVVDPAVSVISTLDLDHTAILGDTLAAIASEKAGIIKPGRPVVVAPQVDEALAVIRARAAAMASPLTVIDGPADWVRSVEIGLTGEHQALNASLAVAAVAELARVDPGLAVMPGAIRSGLRAAWLPGRFEVVAPEWITALRGRNDASDGDRPFVILDGAHTTRAAAALRAAVAPVPGWPGDSVVVCGFAADKDVGAFLSALGPKAVLPVAAASPRAVPAIEIVAVAEPLGIEVIRGPANVGDAVRSLLESDRGPRLVLVTGSFGVVAEARLALGLSHGRPTTDRSNLRPDRAGAFAGETGRQGRT